MDNNGVAIAAIALTGTVATGFFALIRQQNKVHDHLANSMDKVAKSNDKIARATEVGNQQSEKRNGHLGELIVQQGEQMRTLADGATTTVLEAVQNVSHQNVEHMHVKQEVVEHEIVKQKK